MFISPINEVNSLETTNKELARMRKKINSAPQEYNHHLKYAEAPSCNRVVNHFHTCFSVKILNVFFTRHLYV